MGLWNSRTAWGGWRARRRNSAPDRRLARGKDPETLRPSRRNRVLGEFLREGLDSIPPRHSGSRSRERDAPLRARLRATATVARSIRRRRRRRRRAERSAKSRVRIRGPPPKRSRRKSAGRSGRSRGGGRVSARRARRVRTGFAPRMRAERKTAGGETRESAGRCRRRAIRVASASASASDRRSTPSVGSGKRVERRDDRRTVRAGVFASAAPTALLNPPSH
jgi:hypothetical protein